MEIKKLNASDLARISQLCGLVYDICLRKGVRYPEMNTYFEDYRKPEHLTPRMEAGRLHVWGACEGNLLLGIGAMTSDGQITMLYVHPDYQRRGYGKALLDTMRRFAATGLGLPQVLVNAAPAWTGAYFAGHGFVPMNLRQTPGSPYMTLTADSVYIRNYPKKKVSAALIGGIAGGGCFLAFLIAFGYAFFFTLGH